VTGADVSVITEALHKAVGD